MYFVNPRIALVCGGLSYCGSAGHVGRNYWFSRVVKWYPSKLFIFARLSPPVSILGASYSLEKNSGLGERDTNFRDQDRTCKDMNEE